MSSSTGSTINSPDGRAWSRCGSRVSNSRSRASWNATNIAGMVIGFVVFWPIGLFVLAWILSGRQVCDLPAAVRDMWSQLFNGVESRRHAGSNNIVFNEYQQTQHDRITEIKNEIRERARRFAEYREDIQRRRDQEEFDRFMASTPGTPGRSE